MRNPASPPVAKVALEVILRADRQQQLRGDEAKVGDQLVLKAATGGYLHAELRLYRNDQELVFACSEAPPCERRGDILQASVEIEAIGGYQPLLVVSDHPLPSAAGAFDGDTGAVFRAGAQIELGREVQVR